MNNVFLIIGGNLGDRLKNLAIAREVIEQKAGVIKKASSIYETAPWGKPEQPHYYNQVLELLTTLNVGDLMKALLKIETGMGRIRYEQFGERTIDIDILLFNDAIHYSHEVTVPHPRMAERRFVLVPFNEIAPEAYHPVLKKTIAELLQDCKDNLEVKRIEV